LFLKLPYLHETYSSFYRVVPLSADNTKQTCPLSEYWIPVLPLGIHFLEGKNLDFLLNCLAF